MENPRIIARDWKSLLWTEQLGVNRVVFSHPEDAVQGACRKLFLDHQLEIARKEEFNFSLAGRGEADDPMPFARYLSRPGQCPKCMTLWKVWVSDKLASPSSTIRLQSGLCGPCPQCKPFEGQSVEVVLERLLADGHLPAMAVAVDRACAEGKKADLYRAPADVEAIAIAATELCRLANNFASPATIETLMRIAPRLGESGRRDVMERCIEGRRGQGFVPRHEAAETEGT